MTKVLVIEPESKTRTELLDCLAIAGMETIDADNGNIGVEKTHECLPNVVLCNISVPGLNGYEVLKTLRQNPSTAIIPLILLTNKTHRTDIRKAMELGANDCLTKPFTSEEILGAVTAQIKKQSLLKQWFALEFQRYSQSSSTSTDETDEFAHFSALFSPCPQLKKIFDFIENHYHESISLRDVAKHAGFSAAYLTELVKKQTGETINRWIIRRRITAAKSLLLKTDQSVEQIAFQVGYRSLNHFFRQFREYYGTSPQAWRKVNQTKQFKHPILSYS